MYVHIYNFNTSNVTIQQQRKRTIGGQTQISIHLMLLFNPCKTVREVQQRVISIHLMLLFNKRRQAKALKKANFNTSNVTIQQYRRRLVFLRRHAFQYI